MVQFEFIAEKREESGKRSNRRIRREDQIPGVVYGAKKPTVHISLSHNNMMIALQNESMYSHILNLKIDNDTEQVILKDLHRHPYKPKILHVDFMRVSATEKLHISVPLHFLNQETAPGAKADGIVSHAMTELEVKCLPSNLPEYIEVDIGNLELNDSLRIKDIQLPKGVELATKIDDEEHNLLVVTIYEPRAEEESVIETAEGEVVEGKEGEAAADEPKEGKAKAAEGKEEKKEDKKE